MKLICISSFLIYQNRLMNYVNESNEIVILEVKLYKLLLDDSDISVFIYLSI